MHAATRAVPGVLRGPADGDNRGIWDRGGRAADRAAVAARSRRARRGDWSDGRGRRFQFASEELILVLAILAAELGDFLFQRGDLLFGHGMLTAPVAGLLPQFEILASQLRTSAQLRDFLPQLRRPGRLGGRPVHFVEWLYARSSITQAIKTRTDERRKEQSRRSEGAKTG